MRLVPGMTPKKSSRKYKSFVESLTPKGVTVEVRMIHSGDPIVVGTDNPYVTRSERRDARGLRQGNGVCTGRRLHPDCGRF